jgi:probable F420-dependent oxidoreductase
MELGRIGIWTGILDAHPTAAAKEAAQTLEAIGYTTVWVPEAVGRDPLVQSANLLGATTKLKLATGIANIYARDPMTMVSGANCLSEAYPDRFLLGLGVSHAHLVSNVRKHSYDKPLSYMKQYLTDMDSALFMAVGPAAKPPRVLAALGPKMLELSRDQANGAHPYFTTPEHTATAREVLGAGPLLCPEQMVVLSTDPTEARTIARKGMSVYLRAPNYLNNLRRLGFGDDDFADGGSDRLADAIVAWGTVNQIGARVRAHHDAGADHVCIQVLRGDTALPLDEWRALGALL